MKTQNISKLCQQVPFLKQSENGRNKTGRDFPIVGIGASAGGLDGIIF
jgi:chemotaxis response regulator CheB